ncbi:MAG: hypothetical protein IJZ03_07500 [Clostridia bacterium]|nr:hypothetical protein [Clostridia bacterium]
MYRGKYSAPKRSHRRKDSALKAALMSFVVCLMIFSVIGGSLAWLMTSTKPIVNVFTYGDIRITLTETKGEELTDGRYFKMTPGKVIEKDPKISVLADSEDCWLFVKIEKSSDKAIDDFIEYAIADGWTALNGVEGVYYRTVDNSSAEQTFSVLKDDQVTVKGSVTQAMLQALNSSNYPKMTFTGYAVQRDMSIDAIDSAAEAWALIGQSSN